MLKVDVPGGIRNREFQKQKQAKFSEIYISWEVRS